MSKPIFSFIPYLTCRIAGTRELYLLKSKMCYVLSMVVLEVRSLLLRLKRVRASEIALPIYNRGQSPLLGVPS